MSTFESVCVELLFEIFAYLSAAELLQSFSSLNTYFSTLLHSRYLWHTHIGGGNMSLSMFSDRCQRVLSVVGSRVVSLSITLTDTIDGWSLVLSAMRLHQMTMLRRLHLIDINLEEFLRSSPPRQLHTLLIDFTQGYPFREQPVEGAYLSDVCTQLPVLEICRLPFDFSYPTQGEIAKFQVSPLTVMPNPAATVYLHTLTIGMNTSSFLERLLTCVPFIRNLRIDVKDSHMHDFDGWTLPAAADSRLLPHLSRLRLYCMGTRTFYCTVALLSSVFGQLVHLSLKLYAYTSAFGPFIISGDSIQELCLDRLQPMGTYALDLCILALGDREEQILLNSFLKAPFVSRCRPKVIIRDDPPNLLSRTCDHEFYVFTLPFNDTLLQPFLVDEHPQILPQISAREKSFFPRATEFHFPCYDWHNRISKLIDRESSMSLLVPWSLLTTISIDNENTISVDQLEAILRLANHVHTLDLIDHAGILPRAILDSNQDLCSFLNRQIRAISFDDCTLEMCDLSDFCVSLSKRLADLQMLTFSVYGGVGESTSEESQCAERLVNAFHYFVDHLRQLVWLSICFSNEKLPDDSNFLHEVRRHMQKRPLNRPHRRSVSSWAMTIWL